MLYFYVHSLTFGGIVIRVLLRQNAKNTDQTSKTRPVRLIETQFHDAQTNGHGDVAPNANASLDNIGAFTFGDRNDRFFKPEDW